MESLSSLSTEQKLSHESEQQQLKERFIEEIDNLEAGLKVIEKNSGLFSEREAQVVDILDDSVDLQQKARNLLSLDNSMLIREFGQLHDFSLKCRKVSNDVIAEKFTCSSCSVSQLSNEVANFKLKLMPKLASSLTSTKDDKTKKELQPPFPSSDNRKKGRLNIKRFSFSIRCSFDHKDNRVTLKKVVSTNRLLITKDQLTIEQVEYDSVLDVRSVRQLACLPFKEEVEAVYFDDIMSNLIVRTMDAFFHVARNDKSKNYEAKKLDLLVMRQNFICPYIYNNRVHQCYWSVVDEKVCFSHIKNAVFNCSEFPILISSQVYPFFCFLIDKNVILLYHIILDKQYRIDFNIHMLDSIDHVSVYGPDDELTVFVWSKKNKSITKLKCDKDASWSVEKFYWTCPNNFLMDESEKSPHYLFLPAVSREEGGDNQRGFDCLCCF